MTISPTTDTLPANRIESILTRAAELSEQARSRNTERAYRSDWTHFQDWCQGIGTEAIPATVTTVTAYLIDHADELTASTLERRLSGIRKAHQSAGYASPTGEPQVREALSTIRRARGTAPNKAHALSTADLRVAVTGLGTDMKALRDRAILLVGFAGALRRSELVGINLEDLSTSPEGVTIAVRRSKTDQEGRGQVVGITYGEAEETCPVRALRAWITAAGIDSGPLFRPLSRGGRVGESCLSARAVSRIVKAAATVAGLDPTVYSGHSLRSGHITEATRRGAPEVAVMAQSRHSSVEVFRDYYQEAGVFRDNSSAYLGL